MKTHRLVVIIMLSLIAEGCSPAVVAPRFSIETPESFLALDEAEYSDFVYRATSADGVVIGLREINNERRGSLNFWSEAVCNELRSGSAYALIEEQDVTSQSGLQGRQFRFGRDQAGHPYHYWVTIFVQTSDVEPRLWLIEAGGEQEPFERHQEAIEAMITSFRAVSLPSGG